MVNLMAMFLAMLPLGANSIAPDYEKMWKDFKTEYGKNFYSTDVDGLRFAIFKRNVDYIEASNAHDIGYILEVNQFADLTEAEIVDQHTGAQKMAPRFGGHYLGEHVVTGNSVPNSLNWTAQGKVTPVKNQGQCGSCWAFSATGALESAHAIVSDHLVSLSEQQLVDCNVGSPSGGCAGGWPFNAFRYAERHSMCTESEYPYTAEDGNCHANSCTGLELGTVIGYKNVATTEHDLMSAVAKGPVSVTVRVSGPFSSYKSGVLSGGCSGPLNHAVLAVGYGIKDTRKYWNLKNSWGARWGMNGYILLERGRGGEGAYCILQYYPSYPVFSSPTFAPSSMPTSSPTQAPTLMPTPSPTTAPSPAPTEAPTEVPTPMPTAGPTTLVPTQAPSSSPTQAPTAMPTHYPTLAPSAAPTSVPTQMPTAMPTLLPTEAPTIAPTLTPTQGYHCTILTNVFPPHRGAMFGDDKHDFHWSFKSECMSSCTSTPWCECVTFQSIENQQFGRCWRRAFCELAKGKREVDFEVCAKEAWHPTPVDGYYVWGTANVFPPIAGASLSLGEFYTGSADNCKKKCNSTPHCQCVTYQASVKQCWLRDGCDVKKGKWEKYLGSDFTVYVNAARGGFQ